MTNYGDVTGPRWVGGVNAPAPGGGDYEALVKEARRWAKSYTDNPLPSHPELMLPRLADAVEALVEDRDGWRDAARTYKTSRNASDARAEALAAENAKLRDAHMLMRKSADRRGAERDALRAQLDGMTVEWGTLYEATADEEWIKAAASEADARSLVKASPTDTGLRKRLVSPWTAVKEGDDQ